jgi:hypothetical protein
MSKLLSDVRKSVEALEIKLAEDIGVWNDLISKVGAKSALETYLGTHISEITYKTGNSPKPRHIICTSNQRLINVFKAIKANDKRKLAGTDPAISIRTRDSLSVTTFNLVECHTEVIPLNSISVSPLSIPMLDLSVDNLLLLETALWTLLKKDSIR